MVNSVNQIFNKIGRKSKPESTSEDVDTGKYGLGHRHIQALLYFISLTLAFIASGHLGVTIVAMSIPENNTETNSSALTWDLDEDVTHDTVKFLDVYQTYDWPKSTQEIIQGSFFLGAVLLMFPIGLLGQRFGGKTLLQIGLGVNGITSFVVPWCVAWGDWIAFAVIRFIQGCAQSGIYPGINILITHWFPVAERNSLSSFIYAGSGIGSMLAFVLGGILADSRFGWPSTFWVIGVACCIACILVTIFAATTPNDHRYISEAEKIYIAKDQVEEVITKPNLPWKKIITSVPLWATILAHVGNTIAFMFFFMQGPSYMFGVLNFDIMASGVLVALPYLGSCISALAFGNLSDYLTNRKIITIKMARILFNSIACFIPAICLVIITFTTSSALAVVLFVISSTANSGHHTGWMVNYMDLSPNYCGFLMSIGNVLAYIFAVLLPVIVSAAVTDVTDRYQWRIVILLMAGFTFISNVIFILFMSADIQPWNNEDEEEVVKKA
ncbi:unnamed protein product [Euphydryas editha]|uniref:Major facilitator superfamily (MFS) profile domain-containing protein n=1 Tax=Euphydryas editha TaxID=104508 RepID=A0AAU9U049_EUPED|nr:unnamed protein product [Euphydryas editha]